MPQAVLDPAELPLAGTPGASPRVLIVDDQEFIRDMLHQALHDSGLGCEVALAENGVVGCMALSSFRPDLVVLDIVMPELSGADVCWAIKSSPAFARTKVLLITGSPGDPRLTAALAAGADGWMAKPFSISAFVARISELLRRN
jgi:two-component system, OmpR family, phosphate regulon response regulator PhoB